MAIIIPHRFIDRLLPGGDIQEIKTVIIGTFNPGKPDITRLTKDENLAYERITNSKKFQKFNQVQNFYDRPQNRFWKIMDIISNPKFYSENPIRTKNKNGLKHYSKMDRNEVFKKQSQFCVDNGVYITDIVRQIEPKSFDNIYDKFPDKGIEQSKCDWNTDNISNTIKLYKPKHILINFSKSKAINNIWNEIEKIDCIFNNKVISVPSTSGAAGNSFEYLIQNWRHYFT